MHWKVKKLVFVNPILTNFSLCHLFMFNSNLNHCEQFQTLKTSPKIQISQKFMILSIWSRGIAQSAMSRAIRSNLTRVCRPFIYVLAIELCSYSIFMINTNVHEIVFISIFFALICYIHQLEWRSTQFSFHLLAVLHLLLLTGQCDELSFI